MTPVTGLLSVIQSEA